MIWTSCELHKNYTTSTQEVPMYYTWIWSLTSLLCTSYEWAARSIVVSPCSWSVKHTCSVSHEICQYSLQWRHNERNDVSNHRCLDCLLNRLFRRWSKRSSKLCVTGLYEETSSMTGEFPIQITQASNAENVSIWWRHHVTFVSFYCYYIMLHGFVWFTLYIIQSCFAQTNTANTSCNHKTWITTFVHPVCIRNCH